MVADTQQQHQKQPTTVTTAEDEAVKRNTDCVYFLASPLTCKKGSECEYRHSEYARVNPRDCFFWLSGNCLNPKCGFRHPPLEGLLGTQGGASAGSSVRSSHAATAASAASAAYSSYNNTGKQAVPCVFFQKGGCLKGDKCAFLHIPTRAAIKTQQSTEATPTTRSQSLKKPLSGLEKCTQQNNVSSANVSREVEIRVEARAAVEVQNAAGSVRGIEKNVSQHVGYERALHKTAMDAAFFVEGVPVGRSNHLLQGHGSDDNSSLQNRKDADDFLRESSPGFDVLVDNELGDSDYYLDEDRYGRRGEDGRNSADEYGADFNSIADPELFRGPGGYESYEDMQESQHGGGQRGVSSERVSERRAYTIDDSSNRIEESDLRYRLSKQRRVSNGLRSAVTRDHAHSHSEDQNYNASHRNSPQESSLSSRLQGRIKLPGIVSGNNSHLDRGMERGRNNRSRLSPPGRQRISFPGRLRDRIKERTDNYSEDRNFRVSHMRRETYDERNTEFHAPKSLAELKSGNDEIRSDSSLRKRKSLEDHHQQSEGNLSFEGPLPLSEILKRKRAAASGSRISSSVHKEESPQETKEVALTSVSEEETVNEEKTEVGHDQSSEQTRLPEARNEEGLMIDEGTEGNEGDEQNGDYYEEGYEDDGEYYEEGEDVEGIEEYPGEDGDGDDDGNDFAKKIGVVFS